MPRPRDLTSDEMLSLVQELDGELGSLPGKVFEVTLAGGAAIVVRWSTRTSVDMDAVSRLPRTVKKAIAGVAARHPGLPPDWLNDYSAVFRLRMDTEPDLWFDGENIRVYLASPFYVLAMKLFSARMGPDSSDREDVALLMRECGVSTSEQLQQIARDIHHGGLSAVKYLPEHLSVFCDQAAVRYSQLSAGE